MKYFTVKKLFCIYIPLLLLLNAATPKISPQSLFGNMDNCGKSLVYSFVMIPIMEISVLIAHYIIPVPDITTPKDFQKDNENRSKSTAAEFMLNLPNRLPVVFRTIKDVELKYFLAIFFNNTGKVLAHTPCPLPLAPEILLLVSLIFLFRSLMPRSDIPLLLVSTR